MNDMSPFKPPGIAHSRLAPDLEWPVPAGLHGGDMRLAGIDLLLSPKGKNVNSRG